MRVFVYSSHPYDRPFLEAAAGSHQLLFSDQRLTKETVQLANGSDAIAIFTADDASAMVLNELAALGVKKIALRSVGFDHVDLACANKLGICVANVPEYSPHAIAEHAVAMLLTMDRKLRESGLLIQLHDYRLDTLTGFDIFGKTVGIVGTGKIGMAFASIMHGFGTQLFAVDSVQNPEAAALNMQYVSLDELLRTCDIISIHCPLNAVTKYLFNKKAFEKMREHCILINTARGGVVETTALIAALDAGQIGGACLDVYEHEKDIFFNDLRQRGLRDPVYSRLLTMKNVLITGHQAFLTREALAGIARTTIDNVDYWERGEASPNELTKII